MTKAERLSFIHERYLALRYGHSVFPLGGLLTVSRREVAMVASHVHATIAPSMDDATLDPEEGEVAPLEVSPEMSNAVRGGHHVGTSNPGDLLLSPSERAQLSRDLAAARARRFRDAVLRSYSVLALPAPRDWA